MRPDTPEPAKGLRKARGCSPFVIFMSGASTLAFLVWLCWLITTLVISGIPDDGKAELVSTGILAATGVVISAVMAARSTQGDPLEFMGNAISSLRGMLRRW